MTDTQKLQISNNYKNFYVINTNLIKQDNKIINIFYKDDKRSHVRFLFEVPKENYKFLDEYDLIAAVLITKNKGEYIMDYPVSDILVNNEELIKLRGEKFKNVRKMIKKFQNNNYFNLISLNELKDINEIKNFLINWGISNEIKANLSLDYNLFEYIKNNKITKNKTYLKYFIFLIQINLYI
jgi:hypothetical protein